MQQFMFRPRSENMQFMFLFFIELIFSFVCEWSLIIMIIILLWIIIQSTDLICGQCAVHSNAMQWSYDDANTNVQNAVNI